MTTQGAKTLDAAPAQQAKPAAYITHTEQGDMVWTPEMYGEACTYCDEGEFPIPLYTAAPAALQPMTDAEIIEIAVNTTSAEPGRDGYVFPITFARAILKKVEATK